jgi:hypothetical protein
MVRQLYWKWFELVLNRKWFDKVYQHEIVRHFFLHTGIGPTLFSAHWKWFDTFFLLTGNGPTLFSDNQFPSSVAFWACVAEICSAIPWGARTSV